MNINISGEVVRTSQLPKRIIGLGDYLIALNSSPLETSTVLVSDFVSFLNTQFATSLASLTDVSINGPLVGQALVFNGSQWVNQGIGELDTLNSVTTRGNSTTNSITVGGVYSPYLRLDTVATPTLVPGMFAWNDADGTANLRLKGNNVTLQLGQETVAHVVNKTGADLLESQYKVVRVRVASEGGSQGQRLAVVLAQGDNDPDSATTLGVVTENIGNNQEGFITILGNVNNINTTGSLQGETWVDGDVLYLSPITPGSLTKVKPVAPQHTLIVGYVVYAHQNNGKIFVKVDNGYELDELHNVLISSPANNDLLQYNSTQQVWKNIAASVAVPTPTLAQVTTAGNTTTNTITVGGLTVNTTANSGGIILQQNGTNIGEFRRVGNNNRGALYLINSGSTEILLETGGFSYIRSNGFGIGTATDAGYKLDVNGTSAIRGTVDIVGGTLRIASTGPTTQPSYITSHSDGGWNFTTYTHERGAGVHNFTSNNGNASIFSASARAGVNINVSDLSTGNPFSVSGTVTASSAIARGQWINTTLAAAANNDVLVGLDINPTFTNGAFTGVANIDLRTKGTGLVIGSGVGYGAAWGYNNDGIVQVKTNGTSTEMWFRPNNSAPSYTSSYWSKIVQANYSFGIYSGNYQSLVLATGNAPGNGATMTFTGAAGVGVDAVTIVGPTNYGRIALTTYGASPITLNGGNILIGTTTDSIYKLDVNGTTRVTSLYTENIYPVSSNINIWVNSQNSGSRFYFSPVHPDGRINLNAVASTADYTIIRAWHTSNIGLGTGSSVAGGAISLNGDQVLIGTSGSIYFMAGRFGAVNMPYRLGITTNTTVTGFHTGVSNNLTNIESHAFEFTAKSHTFFTGTTAGNQANPNQFTPLHLSTSGNVVVGSTTDSGYKLDVNGTVRVKGTGTTSSTTAFEVQNSISSTTFSVRDDGRVLIPGYTALQGFTSMGLVQFYPVLDGGYTTSSTGRVLRVDTTFNNTVSSTYAYQFGAFSLETSTASTINGTSVFITLAPTSGTQTFTALNVGATINATGTYSGIVRGIFYNPVLTSMTGVTHRAIETTSGNVIFNGGQVGIGTTSPTGRNGYGGGTLVEIVNNTAYASLNLNGGNISAPTYLTLGAQGSGADIRVNNKSLQFGINSIDALKIATTGNVLINTVTDSGYKLDVNGITRLLGTTLINPQLNITAGTVSTQLRATAYTLQIRANDASVLSAEFFQTGNVAIGPGSDTGYKLQVNGNAFIKGSGSTSATIALLVQNSSGIVSTEIYDDRTLRQWGQAFFHSSNTISFASDRISMQPYTGFGIRYRGVNVFELYATETNDMIGMQIDRGLSIYDAGAPVLLDNSAKLQINSTNRGFLPPRLTTAQILAIASPAEGLQVYNTDLKTICFYNGTAWQRVTATAM